MKKIVQIYFTEELKLAKQLTNAIFVALATKEFQTKKKPVQVHIQPSIDF